MIKVNEIFGPTIQGEGMYIGAKTYFIRMFGCDNRCEWCDTVYAREGTDFTELNVTDIMNCLDVSICQVVTLTGGNPCLQDLHLLVIELQRHGFVVHVETQGTTVKDWLNKVNHITVSPKPPSSGNPTAISTLEDFIYKCLVPIELKLVVFDDDDYEYAKKVRQKIWRQFPTLPFTMQSGSMVGNVDRIGWLINKVMQDKDLRYNVRVLPQLHVLLWGSKRGV